MKIIKYRVFKSSKDFEAWQLENLDMVVVSIIPIGSGVSGAADENKPVDLSIMWDVFITYVVDSKD